MAEPLLLRLKRTIFYLAGHYTWAFVTIMTVTLVSCAFSIHYLATLEAGLNDIYENDVRGGDSIQGAYTALLGIETAMKDLVIHPEKRLQTRAKAEVRDQSSRLKAAMNSANTKFYTPKARQAFLASRADWKDFQTVVADLLDQPSVNLKDLARLEEAAEVLQKDFDLLILNRIANSSQGVSGLIFQLRLSLVVTVLLLVVTVTVRVALYWAGHPGRNRRASDKL